MSDLPLIGICKRCKQANSGWIINGRFVCYLCMSLTSPVAQPETDTTASYYYHFTTTTNSTGEE